MFTTRRSEAKERRDRGKTASSNQSRSATSCNQLMVVKMSPYERGKPTAAEVEICGVAGAELVVGRRAVKIFN